MSSIIGRLLNYFLVPLHTRVFPSAEYGVVGELYAYAGFLMVFFVYRMETAYFRFGNKAENRETAFATSMGALMGTTLILVLGLLVFAQPIADWLLYPNHPEYVRYFAVILGLDALLELPFARLRLENRPIRFVFAKIFNIVLNVLLNVFWLWYCPKMAAEGSTWVSYVWSPEVGVGYVFLANLCSTALTLLLLLPKFHFRLADFDSTLLRTMLRYSLPLVVVSFAGIINEMLDRALLKRLLPGTLAENLAELGIYSANYKLAMLVTLFTQAYRYAAEPYFFKSHGDDPQKSMETQAQSTLWFTLIAAFGMISTVAFLPILRLFIDERYHAGLGIVPILLLANVLLGIYYNFSLWYRLRDKTQVGAIISVGSAILTVLLLLFLVPKYGYHGAAWATVICYAFLCAATYLTGRKHYPAPYPIQKMALYLIFSLILTFVLSNLSALSLAPILEWALRLGVLAGFVGLVWWQEIPKKITG